MESERGGGRLGTKGGEEETGESAERTSGEEGGREGNDSGGTGGKRGGSVGRVERTLNRRKDDQGARGTGNAANRREKGRRQTE